VGLAVAAIFMEHDRNPGHGRITLAVVERWAVGCGLEKYEPEDGDEDEDADASKKNRYSTAPPWVGVVVRRLERIDIASARV
jgi:hypothetical protein